jgi:hypothetical protein
MHRLISAIVLAAATAPAVAQVTVSGTITMIRTGWNDEQFAVVVSAPIQNPARCPAADGYITHKSNPGYQTYLSAALAAFAANSQVGVVVHPTECGVAGRPKLIGINLVQAPRPTQAETKLDQLAGTVNQLNGNLTKVAAQSDKNTAILDQMGRQLFWHGQSVLQNVIPGIYNKIGCPDGRHC